jgi:thiamine-monophosphate kinase
VRCAIDISDGLLQDVGHVCRANGVGAVLYADRLPLSQELRQAFPQDAIALAATGGEDYELALVAPRPLLDRLSGSTEIPVTIVGEVVSEHPGAVSLLDAEGHELKLAQHGWDHLRQA